MNSEMNGVNAVELKKRRFHEKRLMILDLLQYFKPRYSKMLINLDYELVKMMHNNLGDGKANKNQEPNL